VAFLVTELNMWEGDLTPSVVVGNGGQCLAESTFLEFICESHTNGNLITDHKSLLKFVRECCCLCQTANLSQCSLE
jgi:hypothetical protein